MRLYINYEDGVSLLKDITGNPAEYFFVKNTLPYGFRSYISEGDMVPVVTKLTNALPNRKGGFLAISFHFFGLNLRSKRFTQAWGWIRTDIKFDVKIINPEKMGEAGLRYVAFLPQG